MWKYTRLLTVTVGASQDITNTHQTHCLLWIQSYKTWQTHRGHEVTLPFNRQSKHAVWGWTLLCLVSTRYCCLCLQCKAAFRPNLALQQLVQGWAPVWERLYMAHLSDLLLLTGAQGQIYYIWNTMLHSIVFWLITLLAIASHADCSTSGNINQESQLKWQYHYFCG